MYIGFVNCIARPLYIIMYKKKGPNARLLGAIAGGLPLYFLGLASLGKLIYDLVQ